MKLYMTTLIAEENFESGDYLNGLSSLNQVLTSYRLEIWPEILYSVVVLAIKCAFLSDNFTQAEKLCQEFRAPIFPAPEDEKKVIESWLGADSVTEAVFPVAWNLPKVSLDSSMMSADKKLVCPRDEKLPLTQLFFFYTEGAALRCKSSGTDLIPSPTQHLSWDKNIPAEEGASKSEEEDQGSETTTDDENQPSSMPLVAQNELLQVEISIPKSATSRTPVELTYSLTNKSVYPLPLELIMGSSDNFMFSGNKQVSVRFPFNLISTDYFLDQH